MFANIPLAVGAGIFLSPRLCLWEEAYGDLSTQTKSNIINKKQLQKQTKISWPFSKGVIYPLYYSNTTCPIWTKLVGMDKFHILWYIPLSQIRSYKVKVIFSGQRSNYWHFCTLNMKLVMYLVIVLTLKKNHITLRFHCILCLVSRPKYMPNDMLLINNNNNKPKFQYHFLQMSFFSHVILKILLIGCHQILRDSICIIAYCTHI